MWAVISWFGRFAWQVFRWGYVLPGIISLLIVAGSRQLEEDLRKRQRDGVAAYPILNYLILVSLGVIRPIFEAGWMSRMVLETSQLLKDIVAGTLKRQQLKGLAPRVIAAQVTPYPEVVWMWLVDWLFSPAWLP